jgi:hypothetical protein
MYPVLRLVVLLCLACLTATAVPVSAPRPALVVVLSIDQFRGDYLTHFRPYFGPDGFNRLMEGAVFAECHHRHSYTKTGPGHASLLTGVHADVHGIIANDWRDRNTFAPVSCVGDDNEQVVGLPPSASPRLPGVNNPYLGRSPRNLLADTIGDELKAQPGSRSRVYGVAGKDRAAILMSGHRADTAYFMEFGRMISSTYYGPELPAWAQRWNEARKADVYFGRTWDRLLPVAEYDKTQGPDDMEGEDATAGQLGRIFPKKITGGLSTPGPDYYSALENTPYENELVVDFAETLITEEKLGAREGTTDMLCLGFSANDHIGHLWGPDSHEVMDVTLRTDRLIAEFLRFLDQRVGQGRYLVVLTADHGSCPTPEHIHTAHPETPAGRLDTPRISAVAEAALNRAFGPLAQDGKWTLRDDAWLLLLPAGLREKGVEPEAARRVVREALLALDFIRAAYTRGQLEEGGATDELGRAAQRSFNRARSGDVFYQTVPYYFSRATGSNHGSPYDYDTHVPLVWFGGMVKPGTHAERVGVEDLAPTLAQLLGLPAPARSQGRVLDVAR